MEQQTKYIGDGIYVKFDGYYLRLLANDPHRPTDKIAIEDHVAVELIRELINHFGEWILDSKYKNS